MQTAQPPINFINVSYFFQLVYNLLFSGQIPTADGLVSLAVTAWLWICIVSFLVTLGLIGALVYFSLRLYQIAEEEDKKFGTISKEAEHVEVEHSRWAYIMQLIESTQQSDWRTAIIEADIMLDELLTKQGYQGDTVGEKLKVASFGTINDAWEAHKVRNDIAHQGSAYDLTDRIAYRTIHQFENVFREFKEI